MITAAELYSKLDHLIPASLSCEWDNDGFMVCADSERTVKRAVISLDATDAAVAYAVDTMADALITHHPIIFKKLSSVTDPKLIKLIQSGISVMSFHTRLDALPGGVNHALAVRLDLGDTEPLGGDVGVIGNAHAPLDINAYAAFVRERLGCVSLRYIPSTKIVHRVAVIGGAGKDYAFEAAAAGADVFVTGEAGHHCMLDCAELGMTVIEAGHYETEQPVCDVLQTFVRDISPETETVVFESQKIDSLA